jgi:hypothetical protein
MVCFTLRLQFPPPAGKQLTVSIAYEAGCFPHSVWTLWRFTPGNRTSRSVSHDKKLRINLRNMYMCDLYGAQLVFYLCCWEISDCGLRKLVHWKLARELACMETKRAGRDRQRGRWPGFYVHTIQEYLRPLGIQYSLIAAPYSQEDDTNVQCVCVCLLYKANPGQAYSYIALSLQLDPQKSALFPTCQLAIQSYCTLQWHARKST